MADPLFVEWRDDFDGPVQRAYYIPPEHPAEYVFVRDCVLEQDQPGAMVAQERAIPGWMQRSARDLTLRSAVEAMHADRLRMANALRNRVIYNDHSSSGMDPELLMKIEEMLLDLANQIEDGTLGVHPH